MAQAPSSSRALCDSARQVPIEHCDDEVRGHQQVALEPIRSAVNDHREDDDHTDAHDSGVQGAEVQVHRVLANYPPADHREGHDEERHLRGGADRDADREPALVHYSEADGRGVLARVADYRQEDDADEVLIDARVLDHLLQRGDEEVRRERDEQRRGQHHHHRNGDGEGRLLVLAVLFPDVLGHGLPVRHQLEKYVGGVCNHDDDGADPGDGEEDALHDGGPVVVGLRGKHRHQAEGEAGEEQHGRVDEGGHDGEGLHLLADKLGVGLPLRAGCDAGQPHVRQAARSQHVPLPRVRDQAAEEEGHAQHQQQVRQNRSQEGCLHDVGEPGTQRLHHDHHLYGVAERGVQEARQHVVLEASGKLFRAVAQDLCQGHQGKKVEPERADVTPPQDVGHDAERERH
mmetsp:Transcript_47309/g.148242  ORF Transcript_47309/g.148242 Transcript_47309/m.148242 type:complete len:402 (+) Transcript_47309:177-1382(+)